MDTEAREKWKARKKWKARVSFFTEVTNPFNFNKMEPPAIILPFNSNDIPPEVQNWSLVAEKASEVIVDKGRRCCECLVAFLEESADVHLRPGLTGMFLMGSSAIASVTIHD